MQSASCVADNPNTIKLMEVSSKEASIPIYESKTDKNKLGEVDTGTLVIYNGENYIVMLNNGRVVEVKREKYRQKIFKNSGR